MAVKREERQEPAEPDNGSRRPTSANESALSFESEPGEVEGSPDQGGSMGSDAGRSSPRAAFTPGPPANPRSPFWTPTVAIMVAALIALLIAAVWLF